MINSSYWVTNYKILLEDEDAEDFDIRLAKLIYLAHEKGFVEWENLDRTKMGKRGVLESSGHKIYIFLIYDTNSKSSLNPCFRVLINAPGSDVVPDKRTTFFLGDDAWGAIFRIFADKIKIKELFPEDVSCTSGCSQGQI